MSQVMLQKLYKQEELIKQQIQCEIKQIQLDNDIKALQLERKKISDEQKRLEQPTSDKQKELEQVFKEGCEIITFVINKDYNKILNNQDLFSYSSTKDSFLRDANILNVFKQIGIINSVDDAIASIKKKYPGPSNYLNIINLVLNALYENKTIDPSIAIIYSSTYDGINVYRIKDVPISRTICIKTISNSSLGGIHYEYLHDDDEYDINEVVYRFDWKNPDTNRFRRKFIKFMST